MKNPCCNCFFFLKRRNKNKNKAEEQKRIDPNPDSIKKPKNNYTTASLENTRAVSLKASSNQVKKHDEKNQKETKEFLDKKEVEKESISEEEKFPTMPAINTENPLNGSENSEKAVRISEKSMENAKYLSTQSISNNLIKETSEKPKVTEQGKKVKKIHKKPKFYRNVGLKNIGNSFYMNSIIQILASIPEFIKTPVKSLLLSSLIDLIAKLTSSSNIVETEPLLIKFKNTISQQYPMFSGASENDAKELFTIITGEAYQAKPSSEQFTLVKEQIFTCAKGHKSSIPDFTNFLTFSVAKHRDLQTFINGIKAKTRFELNNQLFCNGCQHNQDTDVEVVNIYWPKILTFYLPSSQANLTVPENLDADEFKYKIFGAICYYGNHFIAFVKDDSNGLWKEFNDAIVGWRDPDWDRLYLVFYRRLN